LVEDHIFLVESSMRMIDLKIVDIDNYKFNLYLRYTLFSKTTIIYLNRVKG